MCLAAMYRAKIKKAYSAFAALGGEAIFLASQFALAYS